MTVRILIGDCLESLRTLPAESIHCCVTSPPYWGLRDYGMEGQIGLEKTPEEYTDRLVEVFREVLRVLRKDGTLWLNLGDSYNAYNGNRGAAAGANKNHHEIMPDLPRGTGLNCKSLKNKDLVGIPWRVAFALQADGWYLRSDIIWHKPNPMPESVTDRPTKAHEYLFLMAKSDRYFYDADAIKETALQPLGIAKLTGQIKRKEIQKLDSSKLGSNTGAEWRNKRTVWTVATTPFSGSHFATFPPKLIEPCILAGCPAGGTVLDPFGGAGTTGLVADRLGRNAVLLELNPQYAEMGRDRIQKDAGMMAEVLISGAAA